MNVICFCVLTENEEPSGRIGRGVVQTPLPPEPVERCPGDLKKRFEDDPLRALTSIAKECGDIAHFSLEGHDIYLLNKPEYVHRTLVTQAGNFNKVFMSPALNSIQHNGLIQLDGAYHHQQKKMLQPLFYSAKLNTYADMMVDCAKIVSDRWLDGRLSILGHR